MLKFVLVLVVAVFSAGSSGAVDLQPGDLITMGIPPGTYEANGYPVAALTLGDLETGELQVISGCADVDCTTVIGSGPIPRYFGGIAVVSSGEILVEAHFSSISTNGEKPVLEGVDGSAVEISEGHPLAPCNDAVSTGPPLFPQVTCVGLLSIDPTTGDRSLIAASLVTYAGGSQIYEILVGSEVSAIKGGALAIVPPDPDPIYAGLPGLGGWAIPLLVGFMIGASYMKGKYDGRVVQA